MNAEKQAEEWVLSGMTAEESMYMRSTVEEGVHMSYTCYTHVIYIRHIHGSRRGDTHVIHMADMMADMSA